MMVFDEHRKRKKSCALNNTVSEPVEELMKRWQQIDPEMSKGRILPGWAVVLLVALVACALYFGGATR